MIIDDGVSSVTFAFSEASVRNILKTDVRTTTNAIGKVYQDRRLGSRYSISWTLPVFTDTVRDDLSALLKRSVGKPVTITDDNGRVWTGFITNVPNVLREIRDNICNEFSTTIDFLGV